MTENFETICAFTISLEHKTTYAHLLHMFFFPHEENISSKPGFNVFARGECGICPMYLD